LENLLNPIFKLDEMKWMVLIYNL